MEKRTRNSSTTKYRLSGTERSYASRQANRNRRKPKRNMTVPIVSALAIFTVAAGAFIGVVATSRRGAKATESTAVMETALKKSVMVDDIDIGGMSRQKAYDAIMKKYEWAMSASYNGDKYDIPNIIGEKLDTILDEIFTGTPKETYTINFTGLDEEVNAQVDEIAKKWDIKATNASLSSFNKETNEFVYADGNDGVEVDKDKLRDDIKKAIEEKNFKTDIAVNTKLTKPEIASKEDVKQRYKVIGTFTTTTTSNKDRNTNISLASAALDGLVIKPGEEFSFNNTTGNRTLEKGYRPAGAYLNGKLVEEPGGGVCQVSSTLYNAVIFAGLETTERHAHSFEPSYVTPGEDAMVSYDGYAGPDMKFVNTSDVAIVIRAKLVDQKLTTSIVGIPILSDDEKVYMTSKKTGEYDEPAPEYENDTALAAGQEVVVKAGKKGSRWETNIVHKKGDNIVTDKLLHYSTYRGKPGTVKKNLALAGGTTNTAVVATEQSSAVNETTKANSETVAETKAATETVETRAKQAETKHTEAKQVETKPAETKKKEVVETKAPETKAAPQPTADEIIAPNPGGAEIGPGQ